MAGIFNTTLTSGPVSSNNKGVLHTGTAGAVLLVWTWGNESTSMSAVNAGATQLTRLGAVNAGTSRMELWGLTSAPAGILTISAIVVGNNPQTYALLAQTYTGVRNPNPFGTVATGTAGAATVANLSASATTSSLVAFAFGISANTSLTLQNGTLDATATASVNGRIVIGHIAGAGPSVSISCSSGASAQWGYMGVPLFDAPSMSTVREDFNSALDTSKWFTYEPAATPNSSSATFVAGELVLTPAQSNGWSAILYMGIANGFYKMDSTGVYVKMTQRLKTTNDVAGGYTDFYFYENDSLNDTCGFRVNTDKTLQALIFAAGVTSTAVTITSTWDTDNTPWLKLAYSAGSNVAEFWTAPDTNGNPGTWTQRTTLTMPWLPNLSKIAFQVQNDNWVATGNLTQSAKFDNFNDTRRNISASITDSPDLFSASGTVVQSTNITGRLSATDAADRFSAPAQVIVTGRLSATDATDRFTAPAQLVIQARLSATDSGSDVFSSSAKVRVTGRLSATDAGADLFSASGQVKITARLSATDAADVFSSSGQVRITARLSATDAADVFSASAKSVIAGRLSATDVTDRFSASANVVITGRLSATDARDTFFAISGLPTITGSVSATDAPDTLSAAAYVVIAGRLSATDAPDLFSATGTVQNLFISARLSATDSPDIFSATGYSVITARLSATDATDRFSSSATVVPTSAAPVVVAPTPDPGSGGGHKKPPYIRLPSDYWEARERYLKSLAPEIESEPEPDPAEISSEIPAIVQPEPDPQLLISYRFEREQVIASIPQATSMRQLRAAGDRLRLINQQIVQQKRQQLLYSLAEEHTLRTALAKRRADRQRRMSRLRRTAATLELARSVLNLYSNR